MSPQPTTATAKDRKQTPVVRLADETVKRLDSLIQQEVRKVREAGGIGVPPTRAQMVEALVRNAHDHANGTGE